MLPAGALTFSVKIVFYWLTFFFTQLTYYLVYSASYPVGTRGSFPGGEVAGAWSWQLTSIWWWGWRRSELYLHSPNMSSWRGAQL